VGLRVNEKLSEFRKAERVFFVGKSLAQQIKIFFLATSFSLLLSFGNEKERRKQKKAEKKKNIVVSALWAILQNHKNLRHPRPYRTVRSGGCVQFFF
jgi:hypothetical protein